ncbi:NAD(P)/FAD-dependent oxidoreductase [Streptomyces sp. NP160]|uniref:dihydrolipoyl dehydrogenase family protein n=1 Tax=Streptomyces sp. NP160 TaxID=2586637 RepID=UPI001C573075|nr:NAD(P)/FAD-dependent oxidoreductase [Streptomyces sp. NP160]
MTPTVDPDAQAYDVVVIGAGPAGTAAALHARRLGATVAVVEASRVGGTCVNTGCVPTRVLAKAARLVRDARGAGAHGIEVEGVSVDWSRVVSRVHARVDAVRAVKREGQRFAEAGVDLFTEGRARFADPHVVVLDSGRQLRAGSTVLAVGGRSRRLPVPGAELALVPEEVLHQPSLPPRVAVIGAGNTGAQLVTVFSAFGSAVTLLDLAPRVLSFADHDVSARISAAFTAQGVRVLTGIQGVERLERASSGAVVLHWLDERGAASSDEFDAVVMATGWPAALDGLDLEAAGVRFERNRVPVDEHYRTNVPHVLAVGDVIGTDMLVQAAQFEGETAAANAVLGAQARRPHELLPSGGFTDPDYAGVGLTEEQARKRAPGCRVATVGYDALDRAVIDDRSGGFLKLVVDSGRTSILGAHAVGESAVEVIQAMTTAMAAGVELATLAQVRFAYPTYSAVIGLAARLALSQESDAAELH